MTQAETAEMLGIPLRTYVHLEQSTSIPKPETRRQIAERFGVPETALFLDPDLSAPTVEQVSEVLLLALQDEHFRATFEDALRAYMPKIRRKK